MGVHISFSQPFSPHSSSPSSFPPLLNVITCFVSPLDWCTFVSFCRFSSVYHHILSYLSPPSAQFFHLSPSLSLILNLFLPHRFILSNPKAFCCSISPYRFIFLRLSFVSPLSLFLSLCCGNEPVVWTSSDWFGGELMRVSLVFHSMSPARPEGRSSREVISFTTHTWNGKWSWGNRTTNKQRDKKRQKMQLG